MFLFVDKAFRHGDIEEILPTLVKKLGGTGGGGGGGGGGGSGGSGGWLAFVASFLSFGSGRKFTKMDMKRIYFVRLRVWLFVRFVWRDAFFSVRAIGCATTRR